MKYTKEQIETVCKMLENSNYSISEIIDETGVERNAISNIVRGAGYKKIAEKYNIKHRDRNGLHTNYTEEQIRQVCNLIMNINISFEDIAKETGVSTDEIYNICFGKRWLHISKEYNIRSAIAKRRTLERNNFRYGERVPTEVIIQRRQEEEKKIKEEEKRLKEEKRQADLREMQLRMAEIAKQRQLEKEIEKIGKSIGQQVRVEQERHIVEELQVMKEAENDLIRNITRCIINNKDINIGDYPKDKQSLIEETIQINKICKMIEEPRFSFEDIAKALGIDINKILSIYCRNRWAEVVIYYNPYTGRDISGKALSDDEATMVCKLLSRNTPLIKIVEQLGVTIPCLLSIINKKNYKHISDKYKIYNNSSILRQEIKASEKRYLEAMLIKSFINRGSFNIGELCFVTGLNELMINGFITTKKYESIIKRYQKGMIENI